MSALVPADWFLAVNAEPGERLLRFNFFVTPSAGRWLDQRLYESEHSNFVTFRAADAALAVLGLAGFLLAFQVHFVLRYWLTAAIAHYVTLAIVSSATAFETLQIVTVIACRFEQDTHFRHKCLSLEVVVRSHFIQSH